MFKKALAHHSNATPIRSSARRALVTSIFAQYPALSEHVGEEEGMLSEKDLGRALVPDGVRSSNFETSAGIEGTMYLSPDGDPLWLSIGRGSKELVPTLALLARLPHDVHPFPVLQLPSPLPPPLLAGAALFLPAVRHLHTPWRLPALPAGAIVALAAGGSGDVLYVGVGRVAAADGLEGALGRLVKHRNEGVERDEGKFADIICIIDDHLWEMGSKPTLAPFALPAPRDPLMPPPQDEPKDVDEAAEGVAAVSLDDNAEEPQIQASEPLAPAEVSTLLSAALLQTLATLPAGTLPLPASQLYSAHILPNRPAYIPPERREDVVIGRSEWKKLAKWMKEVAKDGVIKTKETKGEVVVTSFDPKHPAIDGHASFKTISEDEAKAARRAAREEEAAVPKQMDIQELWKPAGSNAEFWAACGIEKGSLNQPSAIKPLVDAYIERNGLEDKEHRRLVNLDKALASAVGGKEGQTLIRDEFGGHVKKGALTPISIVVKTRQGRKQVTLVAGLEGFGIDPDDFADDLRRRCAGSTSVQPLTGSSPKLNLKEVMVQGSQGKAVTEALTERGVPRRWIKDEGKKK